MMPKMLLDCILNICLGNFNNGLSIELFMYKLKQIPSDFIVDEIADFEVESLN